MRAFVAARTELASSHPHLAGLALRLELVPVWDYRCPTASTDSRAIYFRPDHVLSLPEGERLLLFLHEVLHCALGHFRRDLPGDREEWNIAQDHEVNDILGREGFALPHDWIHFDPACGMSAEAVYSNLDALLELEGAEHHGGRVDVHPNEWKDMPQAPGETEIDPRMPGRIDEEAQGSWEALATMMAAQGRANERSSALLERLIERVRVQQIDWRSALAQFLSSSSGGTSRWLPPARRHAHRGLYLPSRDGGSLRVVLAVDTSGSTAPFLASFAEELLGLVGSFESYELWLLSCDDSLRSIEHFDSFHPLKLESLTFHGGGNTSFHPPFEWLEREGIDADVFVYLTDGLGKAPKTPPVIPTLWVLTPGGNAPAAWGQVAWFEADLARPSPVP